MTLGALDSEVYNGTLTPNGLTYRLGGGGGTLTFTPALTLAGGSLAVNDVPTGGKVILTNTGNTFTGTTAISYGTLQVGDGVSSNGSLPSGRGEQQRCSSLRQSNEHDLWRRDRRQRPGGQDGRRLDGPQCLEHLHGPYLDLDRHLAGELPPLHVRHRAQQ